jgi:hypothetical protein
MMAVTVEDAVQRVTSVGRLRDYLISDDEPPRWKDESEPLPGLWSITRPRTRQ